jgi:hypothetical protein
VTYKNGITLGAAATISTNTFANVAGMNFNFVAQNTSAVVIFSASGYGYTNSMSYVRFQVQNNGASIGETQEKIQNYDDVTGTITTWHCGLTKYVTGLTPGATYTLNVRGLRDGISGTYNAIIDPAVSGHHMTLTVIQ